MTYQALARKWRPKTFAELSGQEHVVRALSNALERGRLHHAYLLTGTRGVGKTTIARILAKSLNCVRGVTATPCGVCAACVDIDAGRFVDLLELDAASNTGIDNMREILDNARYAPTVGRYKVYLIDEAHMLSKPAFNSMLKTLEEPPEHVKFVLATTDAPKIPVTVLSRCLQFNLKLLPPATIAARLSEILRAEGVAFDDSAMTLIARAARGSMRDALSVLDQALAYGAGEVRDGGVRSMLGTVDADYAYRIVDALIARDGPALLAQARTLTERGVSLAGALEELSLLLHRIALVQAVPDASDALPDAERVKALAEAFPPDAVQLAYQICLQGRTDLSLAPDEQTGFSMTLLRLLAFDPANESPGAAPPPRAAPKTERTGDAAGELESAAAGPSASAAHGGHRADRQRERSRRAGHCARPRDLAHLRRRDETVRHGTATRRANRTQSGLRQRIRLDGAGSSPSFDRSTLRRHAAPCHRAGARTPRALALRDRRRRGQQSGGKGKARARGGAGEDRSGVSRRSVRPGPAVAFRCARQAELDQTDLGPSGELHA